MKDLLTIQVIDEAGIDLPVVIKRATAIEQRFLEIEASHDSECAHDIAFELAIETPHISSLEFFVSLNHGNRDRLLMHLNIDAPGRASLARLSWWFRGKMVYGALRRVHPSFLLGEPFKNAQSLAWELKHGLDNTQESSSWARMPYLDLSDSRLEVLPPEIGELTGLVSLDLSGNRLISLPKVIAHLTGLVSLDLSGNNLKALPAVMERLTNLARLSLANNPFLEIPAVVWKLTNLVTLDLSNTELAELPEELSRLSQLAALYLARTHLKAVPESVLECSALAVLHLQENQIHELPLDLARLSALKDLDLDGNPLIFPPTIIAERGTEAILAFLREEAVSAVPVWSSRLILVGEGEVGKTSILRRLLNAPFNNESTTHGLEINHLCVSHPEKESVNMTLSCWDFGGQQIMHATHQFFINDRALFLLVWNARLGYKQSKLYTWLDNIKARAPEAPILLVATHCADRRADLPFHEIIAHYPQVVGKVSVDSSQRLGIPELRQAIRVQAAKLPLMGTPWPLRWLDVVKRIRAIKEKYIFPNRLYALMEEQGVTGDNAVALTTYLHQLGELLFFSENDRLKDVVIIDSAWMARHISEMLESEQVNFGLGMLEAKHMDLIWRHVDPPVRNLFLNLMEEFDLSYRTQDNDKISIVVEKLSENPPLPPNDYEAPWHELAEAPSITLSYDLNTIPPGIPTWFIARSHRFTTGRHWRYGALFADGKNHLALIKLDELRNSLDLTVRGPYPHNFFALLRDGLEVTLSRYPGLEIARMVPCPGHDGCPCPFKFPLETLEKALKMGRQTISCFETMEDVQIARLIYGLTTVDGYDRLLRSFERMARDNETGQAEMKGLIQREFLKLDDCRPRLFLVWSTQEGLLQRLNRMGSKKVQIQLYCEAEGCWHQPAEGGHYELTMDPEWPRNVQPYYGKLVHLMLKMLPMPNIVDQTTPSSTAYPPGRDNNKISV